MVQRNYGSNGHRSTVGSGYGQDGFSKIDLRKRRALFPPDYYLVGHGHKLGRHHVQKHQLRPAPTDELDKFISQGTGRNIALKSLVYENDANSNYLWLGGEDSATPANISVANSVRIGSSSDTAAMKGVLVFGGNGNVGAGSSGGAIGPCQKVSIGGDVALYGNSTLGFNTNLSETWAAPSVSIGAQSE